MLNPGRNRKEYEHHEDPTHTHPHDGARLRRSCAGRLDEMAHGGEKRTPGKQPDKDQHPEERNRDRLVIHRLPASQKAEELLVDKEVPQKSGIAVRGDHMPRERKREKEEDSLAGMKMFKTRPAPHPTHKYSDD